MINTGITYLDKITGGYRLGDNVVWQISDGISVEPFIKNFFIKKNNFNQNVIYINFNFSPHTICKKYNDLFEKHKIILVDAFTYGKGNGDQVFLDFYSNTGSYKNSTFVLLKNPKNIQSFIEELKKIEDKNKDGNFYIFDSLTGMSELWKVETDVLDFFTYTCPKLYDMNTLAYWIYEKNAHSKEFIAGISHITQIVFSLNFTAGEYFDFNIQKLDGRSNIFNNITHKFKFINDEIEFQGKKPDDFLKIGEKVKNLRKKTNITQSELASFLSLTPGAVSQIENSIISPSLNTLLQLSSIFNKTPEYFLGDMSDKNRNNNIIINKRKQLIKYSNKKIIIYDLLNNEDLSIKIYSIIIKEGQSLEEPIMFHKGDEILYIIDGSLIITVDNEERELHKGESVILGKSFIEKWKNKNKSACECIYILL